MTKKIYKYYSRWDKMQGYLLSLVRWVSEKYTWLEPLYYFVLDKVSTKAVEFSPIW